MGGNLLSERLRKSILVYSILSGLLLAAVVVGVSMVPFYRTMRAQREDKLLSVMHARATMVEVFLWEAREIARQIASRTAIRDHLQRRDDDRQQAKASTAAIQESLVDAVSSLPIAESAYVYDVVGSSVAYVGMSLPPSIKKWQKEHLEDGEGFRPVLLHGKYHLLYRTAIHARNDEMIGALDILYELETLQNLLARLPDLGLDEDTFLGFDESGDIRVFLEMQGRERQSANGRHSPRVLEALRRTVEDRTGLLEPADDLSEPEIFAYRPITGTDWGIAVRQTQRTLLADIDEQLYRIGGIVFLLIVIISVGMFLLLRPLAGKIVMHSRELEDRVDAQTTDLDTERKRLLATTRNLERQKIQLESANEDMEAFSRTVAHDLRTPLVTIQGFADLLLDSERIKQDPESRQMLSRIADKSRLMANQIKSLLRYARAGKAELKRTQVNLSRLSEEVAADLREEYHGREANMEIQPDLTVSADEPLLYIVMENLLGNAWKYTSLTEDARIEVGVKEHRGEAVYYVRDNGTGFDMMFAERLFLPFQRLHSDAEFSGTGIGLSTVKRIIEQHDGRIWAEGKLGAGATFYFTFPEKPA